MDGETFSMGSERSARKIGVEKQCRSPKGKFGLCKVLPIIFLLERECRKEGLTCK